MERLIPINNVHDETDRIRAVVPLPSYVDRDALGLNIPGTLRLMNLGGISFLEIKPYEPDRHLNASVVGINSQGGAVGVFNSAIEQQSPYDLETLEDSGRLNWVQNHVWAKVSLGLDLNAINRQISDEGQDIRFPGSWAKPIDSIVRQVIRRSGTKHLLTNLDKEKKFFAYFFAGDGFLGFGDAGVLDILTQDFNPHIPSIEEFLIALATQSLVHNTFFLTAQKMSRNDYPYRVSLLPGYELDRAVVLQIMSRVKSVIKAK